MVGVVGPYRSFYKIYLSNRAYDNIILIGYLMANVHLEETYNLSVKCVDILCKLCSGVYKVWNAIQLSIN